MRPFSTKLAALTLSVSALAAVFSSSLSAQEWTRFRGPNGQGQSSSRFASEYKSSEFVWRMQLPGIGHSSPAIWGDRAFLLSADPESATRFMLCLDTTNGKILWTRKYESSPHHLHARSSYASSSPAVDAERVYVGWSAPEETTLLALRHDGRDAWKLNLGPWVSQHGFGTSPMLYKDMVILSNSQQARRLKQGQKPGDSFLLAFDRKTGREKWRLPRKSVNVCYSTPCIYAPPGGGPDQLIQISTGNGMYSVNPQTGKENWSLDLFKMRTVSSPVIAGGLLFGTTGSGGGGNYLVAVRPGAEPKEVYRIKTAAPYVPAPVAYKDLLFLWYDRGILTCIDSKTGKVHYRERLRGGFSGCPVVAGDKVYCIREDGVLMCVAASKEFKLLGETPLGEESRATPAIAGDKMLLRTYSHLICVGGKST